MLSPISRETLQTLKAKKDEEVRVGRVKYVVAAIYGEVLGTAQTSTDPSYSFRFPDLNGKPPEEEFHRKNMMEIIGILNDLFPNCSVRHLVLGVNEYISVSWA